MRRRAMRRGRCAMADAGRTALRVARALPGIERLRGAEAPAADFSRTRADVVRLLVRWSLLLIGPLALVVVSTYLYLAGGRYVSIDNAYVKADMVNVAN